MLNIRVKFRATVLIHESIEKLCAPSVYRAVVKYIEGPARIQAYYDAKNNLIQWSRQNG